MIVNAGPTIRLADGGMGMNLHRGVNVRAFGPPILQGRSPKGSGTCSQIVSMSVVEPGGTSSHHGKWAGVRERLRGIVVAMAIVFSVLLPSPRSATASPWFLKQHEDASSSTIVENPRPMWGRLARVEAVRANPRGDEREQIITAIRRGPLRYVLTMSYGSHSSRQSMLRSTIGHIPLPDAEESTIGDRYKQEEEDDDDVGPVEAIISSAQQRRAARGGGGRGGGGVEGGEGSGSVFFRASKEKMRTLGEGNDSASATRARAFAAALGIALAFVLIPQDGKPSGDPVRDAKRSAEANRKHVPAEELKSIKDVVKKSKRALKEAKEKEKMKRGMSGGGGSGGGNGVQHDMVIVGGGAAGMMAAGLSIALGAKTLLIERSPEALGGECTNTGCVPSKSLLYAASLRGSDGGEGSPAQVMSTLSANASVSDWRAASARKVMSNGMEARRRGGTDWVFEHAKRVVRHVKDHESAEAIDKAGIKTLFGDAAFTSPNNLQVTLPNGTLADVSAKGFLICAGAGPSRGTIRGLRDHWTYRDVLTMSGEAPESLIIAGAGPVGCELAQAFAQMGTNVTLVGPRVLPREAIDASGAIEHALVNDHGVNYIKGRVGEVLPKRMPGDVTVRIEGVDSEGILVTASKLLVAAGRDPNVRNLGLEKANVAASSRGIKINRSCQTSNPLIWAAGDVCDNGGEMYSHFAGWQAFIAIRDALFPWYMRLGGSKTSTFTVVPRVTYTKPEVASCGLSKELALRFYGPPGPGKRWIIVKVKSEYQDRAVAEGESQEGFIEVYVHKGGRVMGGSIVSNRAGELISEVALAVNLKLHVKDLATTLHPYPSYSFSLHKAWVDAASMNLTGNMSSGLSGKLIGAFMAAKKLLTGKTVK